MGITGILLAGGEAKRLGGGDKCLTLLGGTTILAQTIERAAQQVDVLLLNANGDPRRFSGFDLPVVPDEVAGLGPLAGVLAGMMWSASNTPGNALVASFATDTPYLPLDLVHRLQTALHTSAADIAYATSGGRSHPVFSLWKVALSATLRTALIDRGQRKVRAFIDQQNSVAVDWPATPTDPFLNINTPGELEKARADLST